MTTASSDSHQFASCVQFPTGTGGVSDASFLRPEQGDHALALPNFHVATVNIAARIFECGLVAGGFKLMALYDVTRFVEHIGMIIQHVGNSPHRSVQRSPLFCVPVG